jgi:hypothetical protein
MSKKNKTEICNRTPFALEDIAKMPLLGKTVNKWRQRNVNLHQHPHKPDFVVSVGESFDGTLIVVADDETKAGWATALDYAEHGKVYVSE